MLDANTPGVSIEKTCQEPVNGDDPRGPCDYVLTWQAYCSALCNYTYFVKHDVNGQIYSSAQKAMNVGGCATITW